MTRSTIIEMPMLVRKAEAGSRALWNLYPQMLASDYEGFEAAGPDDAQRRPDPHP